MLQVSSVKCCNSPRCNVSEYATCTVFESCSCCLNLNKRYGSLDEDSAWFLTEIWPNGWCLYSRSVVSRSPSWGIKVPSKRGTDYQRLSGLGSCSWFVWRFFCKRKSRKTMHGIEVMFDYCVCLVEWFCWIYDYLKVETIGVWSVSLARRSEDESVVKKMLWHSLGRKKQRPTYATPCGYTWRVDMPEGASTVDPCEKRIHASDPWQGMTVEAIAMSEKGWKSGLFS